MQLEVNVKINAYMYIIFLIYCGLVTSLSDWALKNNPLYPLLITINTSFISFMVDNYPSLTYCSTLAHLNPPPRNHSESIHARIPPNINSYTKTFQKVICKRSLKATPTRKYFKWKFTAKTVNRTTFLEWYTVQL